MTMLCFTSDYIAGAHPAVLQKLCETNLEPLSGYETDPYCENAAAKIRKACGTEEADVFFLVGGTQTNQVVIDTVLAPYEGVISAKTGHVNVHEAGAIEFTGHKVLELEGEDGKLKADQVDAYIETFFGDGNHEHMVFPGMVYISFPTELGTLYSKAELEALSTVCRKHQIPLYIDGARLGYGLCSHENDITLPELAALCDVFYIGGTKVGALCGEAVVFPHHNAPKHFITQIKQHGAMLAKGRVLGVQFDALFTDSLYFEIGKYAIDLADRLKEVLHEKNCRFYLESPTNQQFIIMEDAKMEEFSKHVMFSFWEKADDTHTVIRLCTSWSTRREEIEALREYL